MKKFFLLSFVMIANLLAGNPNNIGTVGGYVLSLSSDARGSALNASHFATVSGLSSIYYNPAGLSAIKDIEFNVSKMNYLADMSLTQIALGYKINENVSLAVHSKFFAIGDIKVTTLAQRNGTGEIISPNINIYGASIAGKLTDHFWMGASLNILSENYQKIKGSAIAGDLGLQYRDLNGLNFAFGIKNIGSDITYEEMEQTSNSKSYRSIGLPVHIIFSINYLSELDSDNKISLLSSYNLFTKGLNTFSTGLEYAYNDMFFGRVSNQIFVGDKKSLLNGIALGFGLKINIDDISLLDIDYSFKNVDALGFNNINAISINVRF